MSEKSKMPKAFIIMPISSTEIYNDTDHFLHVFEQLFKPALIEAGYEPIFPETKGSDIIHSSIIKNLETAELVLCDMSSLNPNVFFELGIRTALNKPVCMVIDNKTHKIPFDTKIISYITYDHNLYSYNIKSDIEKLTAHINETIQNTPDVNALWNIFGLKIGGKSVDVSVDQNLKTLHLENIILKTKLENLEFENIYSSGVKVEKGYLHICTECNYSFIVKGHKTNQSEYYPFIEENPIEVEHEYVTCPSCRHIDRLF